MIISLVTVAFTPTIAQDFGDAALNRQQNISNGSTIHNDKVGNFSFI
jgi:hypothetical protein